MVFTILFIISSFGLLSYYIIFSRIKISSFDIENSFFNKPVSVIVCTKNELENINQFFPYWINQNYDNFELIIVNDNSTDGSYEYLTSLENTYDNLVIIHTNKNEEKNNDLKSLKGKRYALRKGILASKYDYILLTDADCKPVSINWIKEMTKAFHDKNIEIVLGYSPYFKERSLVNFFIQTETTLTAMMYLGFANIGLAYMGVGRNIAYRKNILTDQLFIKSNKAISGDDDLIVQQLANKSNTAYIISKNSIVESVPEKSFKNWVLQKKRHLGAGIYYKFIMKIILNLFPVLNLLLFISSLTIFLLYTDYFFIILTFIYIFLFLLANMMFIFLTKR